MLLRRMTEHVGSQNWTAIALDFVIVVSGVFLGIQLGNWNEARGDRADEVSYLTRIHEDLTADLAMFDERLVLLDAQLAAVPDATAELEESGANAWPIIRAQYAISGIVPPEIRDTTYTDMVNSGRLSLITDESVRDSLVGYYANDAAFPVLKSEPPFRQMVRGVIPHELQTYMTSPACLPDFGQPRPCAPPDDAGDIGAVAAVLADDETLGRALNYNIAHHKISRQIILALRAGTEAVRADVAEELRSKGIDT